MRLWAKFTKKEKLKYLSHLDLVRTFERSFRRSRLPVTFTKGYNPHVKFAFASALPVGTSSTSEYIDIYLDSQLHALDVMNRLNCSLPDGIIVTDIKEVEADFPSLMSLIRGAEYKLTLTEPLIKTEGHINQCIVEMLNKKDVFIDKKTKKGWKKVDLKPLIVSASYKNNYFEIFLKTGSVANATPEQFIQALNDYTDLSLDMDIIDIQRKGLFINNRTELKETPFDYKL
ncbi:MAG: TIGR03936 family radical SAM-associated protein [Clostridia bacterium]|nr:TIGR03936 family radical SAM-associated protein [Clostridia bacterium]